MMGLVERQFPRAPCQAGVSGTSSFGRFFGQVRDISLGGLSIETDYPFGLGERLALGLRLPGGEANLIDGSLEVEGSVGWIERHDGGASCVGVQFAALTPPALRAIKGYLAAHLPPGECQPGVAAWPLLFSHFDLGPLRLKNRLLMAPMFWGYAASDGTVSRPLIDLYREIAGGGAALVVVANAIVAPEGAMSARALRVHDDTCLPGLTELAHAIREAGAIPCLQLNHAGRFAKVPLPLAPSPVPLRSVTSEMTFLGQDASKLGALNRMSMIGNFLQHMVRCRREMTEGDLEETARAFAAAALRAKRAGFAAVELHGATGYLLSQFLSPRTNHRQDRWGGSLERRMRFPLAVVEAVRGAVGPGFPVGWRFLAEEWLPGGFDLDQARVFAQRLEEAGVAYLSVTGATYESMFLPHVVKRLKKPGATVSLAAAIKRTVAIPVVAAGRINSPKLAERVIENEQADLIGLARGLFADPRWPDKALEGREREITQCRGCNRCLISVIRDEPAVCSRWDARKRVSTRLAVKGDRRWSEVLIAIDGSDASLSAVEYARLLLSGRTSKRITLLHVRPEDNGADPDAHRLLDELFGQARAILAGSGIPRENIIVKVVPERSGIAEEIIREISQGSYGLVMIGRRGVSGSQRLLFGSVSSKVLHSVKDCAVCILG
jgi:2,4-dienoyl-CoA reductase-like NADH-dependent reductase (Old Yellow Enzyme family)/nucleotide-binding universal stress UspA family protein